MDLFKNIPASPPLEIEPATMENTHIRNELRPETTEAAKQQYAAYRSHYGSTWQHRKPASGVYNCFGLLFASRRTGIFEDEEIDKILREDRYQPVHSIHEVKTDDVVIYRLRNGSFAHGARVISVVRRLNQPVPQIWVLSKWMLGWGEDVHPIDKTNVPPGSTTWEIWTDRHGQESHQHDAIRIMLP